jgi:uncharacterized protein (DUF433 family)
MEWEYVEKHEGGWRIRNTRVSLDSVIYQFREGRSPEGIQDSFPVLSLSQVYGAIAFYLDHRSELDDYLAHEEATEEEFDRETARLFPKGAALKERIKEHLSKHTE